MAATKSKKQKIRKKNLNLHYNQTRLNRVLAALGITDLHKTLHADFRETILNNPDPSLVLDNTNGVESECLLHRLEEWKNLSYKGISSSDFTEVMFPLIRYMSSAVGHGLMADHADHKFKKVTKELFFRYAVPAQEFMDYFTDQLVAIMQLVVWEETAPDRQYVRMGFDIEKLPRDRARFKVTADIESIKRVWVCGGWKYQVGTHYDTSFTPLPEMSWLSRCPLDYGLSGESGENLPVYISSHALDRMRERLDDQWARMIAMFAIYFAMDKPVYHTLFDGSGDTMVELRVRETDMKLGYLIVSRTRTEIIIKTFLFITMFQTPEGNKLHKRLRMARPDYDFHRLENYSTLARSDITTHPKLRPVWEECGFGGLLTMIDRGAKLLGMKPKKQAEDLIKYFQLEERA